VRALTEEKRYLSALLSEAEASKLEETTRILSSNEMEIENIRKEHDLELSATDQAWEVALEHQVNLAKSSSLKETKKIKEELDLERSQSQDYKMRLVANLTQVQKELFEVKRENDRMSRGNSREPPASIREPRFVQESAEEEENAVQTSGLGS
jgi:hypothetical protein